MMRLTEFHETWNVGVVEYPDALIIFSETLVCTIQDDGNFSY